MYLKRFALENFRKFRSRNNEIDFVDAKDYKEDETINIAPKTTLIIGKNNSGKTTIVEALKKLVSNTAFNAADFNFDYLKELLNLYTLEYLNSDIVKEVPKLTFTLTIIIDNCKEDLLTNIIPFMTIGDVKGSEVKINARWSPTDEEVFIASVKRFIQNEESYKSQKFDRFLQLINETEFSLVYLNSNNEKRENFSLKKLIDLEPVSANNITSEDCLSKAFSKIVDYRYKQVKSNQEDIGLDELDKEILSINENLTKQIDREHTKSINTSLGKMISGEKCQVLLKSDLNFRTLLNSVLKYEYVEGHNNIPERQFGLGYTNLMMIIADIITYMEKYPDNSFNSQINLISIEEPETFMHPQMQELFIKNVNEMISSLLEGKNKHVNSQIIITTHSPHILNSKIHEGHTFNNINYITENESVAQAVHLSDESVLDVPKSDNLDALQQYNQNLKFLKKHVKFKISELFFADAVIFVEGITEYTLLQYYLDGDTRLNKYYISLILIDGAHAKVYENLINTLGIPTLIITDIDIKREKFERYEKDPENPRKKRKYLQMATKTLNERITTNNTLVHFYGVNTVKGIIDQDYKIKNNLMVLCQKQKIKGYYPTSFEEAFILTNSDNKILNSVLKKVKPDIFDEVLNDGGLISNSYKLQRKLADSKSNFANEILFEILTSDDASNVPALPQYIEDGLHFLEKRLGGKKDEL